MVCNPVLKADMLAVVSRHRGAEDAIKVADLVVLLGLAPSQERVVRFMKRELVEDGHLIASSCGKTPGYFVPVTADEMQEPLRNYKARLKSLAVLIAAIEGAAALRGLFGQLELEIGEQVWEE